VIHRMGRDASADVRGLLLGLSLHCFLTHNFLPSVHNTRDCPLRLHVVAASNSRRPCTSRSTDIPSVHFHRAAIRDS
jgi:hypothetical protein